jgi:RNA polymerase sigma factor (sigma-70 family)
LSKTPGRLEHLDLAILRITLRERGVYPPMNELWEQARAGDKEAETAAFAQLRRRYLALARTRINGPEHEDVVQEACMVVLRKYKDLQAPFQFEPWALQVLHYQIANFRRKSATAQRHEVTGVDPSSLRSPGKTTGDPDIIRALIDCVRKIAGGYRRYIRVLNLVHQGFTTEEICARLKVSRNNLYVMLTRGRRMLEGCLAEQEQDNA